MVKSKLAGLQNVLQPASPAPAAPVVAKRRRKVAPAEASGVIPPRGERGNFVKINLMLPPGILDVLKDEKRERERAGQRDVTVGALVAEAVAATFKR